MGTRLFTLVPQIRRISLLFHGIWLLTVAASAWINHHYSHKELEQTALAKARAIYQRDTAFRSWAASFGGVYVPVDEKNPPNPYLAHLPDRDQRKTDGTPLTLINPAYMVRLVNSSQDTPVTHITSQKPLRPENSPDAWELAALEQLEKDRGKEFFEFTTVNGQPHLRYLRASITENGCLKCHASQGYREGDLRGGMTVSLPLDRALAGHRRTVAIMLGLHLLIYLVGAGLLLKGQRIVGNRLRERDLAIAALEESEANFRTLADFAYAWEYWLGPDGEMRYVSPSVKELTGHGPEQFMRNPEYLQTIIAEEDRELLRRHLEQEQERRKFALDFRIRTATGETRWLHHICRPVFDRQGVFQGRRASNYDITIEKTAKLRNEELIGKLREALEKVKTLSCFLPICASCKKIRDDRGYWNQIETYISEHSETVFSHGICPDCARKLYPGFYRSDDNGAGGPQGPGEK